MMAGIVAAQRVTPAAATDPYWSSVAFLLDGDTTTPATGQSMTVGAGATVDTALKPWGSGSLKFSGAADSYLRLSSDLGFAAGNAAFTIELFVYVPSTASTTVTNCFMSLGDNTNSGPTDVVFSRGVNANANRVNASVYGGSNVGMLNPNFTTNTWHHLALTANSAQNMYLTLDGAMDSTSGYASTTRSLSGVLALALGRSDNPNIGGAGTVYIKGVRVTRANRYPTLPFTPPTGPYPTS